MKGGKRKQLTLLVHIPIDCFGRRRPSVRYSLFSSDILTITTTTQEVKRLQQHTHTHTGTYIHRLALLSSIEKREMWSA